MNWKGVLYMMELKKHTLTALCVLAVAGCISTQPVHAAIPVIDTDNILQQIKTYQETLKLNNITQQQEILQEKEMLSLPMEILNNYKKKMSAGWTAILDILGSHGTTIRGTTGIYSDKNVPEIEINSWFQQKFPGIIGNDLPETMQSARTAKYMAIATLMANNKETVTAIQKLTAELDGINKEIQQAEQESANAEGQMQAQQVANHIAALQTRAQSIKIIIQSLQGQQQALKNQAETQEKKNQLDLQDAQAQSEREAIEKMVQESGGPQKIYDPYVANHALIWNW